MGFRINLNVPEGALRAKPAAITKALVDKLTFLDLKLQQHIQRDKLQGQVLHQRSGKLVGSVRIIPVTVRGSVIEGGVQAGGGVAPYAAVHEFGGTRSYVINPVNKEALRFMIGNRVVFAKSVIHPPLPARPFMSTGLEDMRGDYVNGLREALAAAIGGGSSRA